jgi:hypothetical protein
VTAQGFRRIALGLRDAFEGSHMGHADFRVREGRIFATLGYPDAKWGMVVLTPEQQHDATREHQAMTPAKGAWGAQGSTMVRLADIDEEALGAVLTMAWRNAVARSSRKQRSS